MRSTYEPKNQSGFTLIEIIVSTAIFVVVVSSILTLFNFTLQINRRVQTLREIVQGTRTFTETLTREIRNGRIDYNSSAPECNPNLYLQDKNQALAILTRSGDKLCFYLDNNGTFYLKKETSAGVYNEAVFDSTRFKINKNTFRFYVNPTTNPNPTSGTNPAIQPFVTIVAQFELTSFSNVPTSTINYQTTISTDVYDIFRAN